MESRKTVWHYCPEQIYPLKLSTEQLCGRLLPLIILQNKQTKTKNLVQSANWRIHPPGLSNKLSWPLLGGALQWHHLQRARNAPALGPQQGVVWLEMDAMVTMTLLWVFNRPYPIVPADEMELEWDSVCERDGGQHTADVENKQRITVQILRDSPSSHPPASLSSSGFHAQTLEWLLISLFAEQLTPIPHFMQSLQGDKCLRVWREKQRDSDEGGRQRLRKGETVGWVNTVHSQDHNTGDKHHLEAGEGRRHRVAPLNLRSTADHCNQHNDAGSRRPAERGSYSHGGSHPKRCDSKGAQNHQIMTSCNIWIAGQQLVWGG